MGLAPYPWLERPAEVLAKMLNKLPGGILIYGPRGCGVFELVFALCRSCSVSAPCRRRALRHLRRVQTYFSAETIPTFATS